jgi:CheY-like chemotaxis protein
MDCNMPFMDGYEATKDIREHLKSLNIDQPIIIGVTGHTEPEYIKKCLESGMNQVFSKPVDSDKIKKVLKSIKLVK